MSDRPFVKPPLGASWAGGGPHEGHRVTLIEQWPWKENVETGQMSEGRVRCTCGVEWDFGGYPVVWSAP